MSRINSLAELEEFRKGILSKRDPKKPCITLCSGSACHASGSKEVAASLEEEIIKQGLSQLNLIFIIYNSEFIIS